MASPDQKINDALIVGGGPAGLSAALMLGRSCRRVVVIDAGHPRNVAARELHGFLGRDGLPPHDLLRDGRNEIAKYEVEFVPEEVIKAERVRDPANARYPTAFCLET